MAAPRIRFIVLLIIAALVAVLCGTRVASSQDRAKPRGQGGSQTQSDGRRGGRQPEGDRSGTRDRGRARRDDAETRHPRPGADSRRDSGSNRRGREADRAPGPSYGARNRHPRPDGRYERRYPQWDNYHWRNWQYRNRWHRDRFPRLYFGLGLFDGFLYYGRPFGPHYALPYLYGRTWKFCYWPFPYPPAYGCGYYYVPTQRVEYRDPYTGEWYWEYTDYDYVYLCID